MLPILRAKEKAHNPNTFKMRHRSVDPRQSNDTAQSRDTKKLNIFKPKNTYANQIDSKLAEMSKQKPQILKDPSVKYHGIKPDNSSGDIFLKQNSIFSSGYSTANVSNTDKKHYLVLRGREPFDQAENFMTNSSI